MLIFRIIVFFFLLNPLFVYAKDNCDCKRGYADLVDEIMPSVVSITVNSKVVKSNAHSKFEQLLPKEFRDFFGNMRPFDVPSAPQSKSVISSGSGFVIDASCQIVTNYHIIQNAETINVKFYDGNSYKAKVVGLDKLTDIALLKADHKGSCKSFAQIGNSSNVRVGDQVLAIGSPYGFTGSVSSGIVSAIERDIALGPYDNFIQVDLSLNFGNSGGPLFNMNGEVIGINTAIFSNSGGSIGLGFAIPTETVKLIVDVLKKKKTVKRGCIGVGAQDVTSSIAESIGLKEVQGILIAEVKKGLPADKAGIKVGDIIIEFNGKPVKSRKYFSNAVATYGIDKVADIKVIRNKKTLNLKIKIIEMDESKYFPHLFSDKDTIPNSDENDYFVNELDLSIANIDEETRKLKNLNRDAEGVIVTDILSGSNAEFMGIEVGDIINQLNQVFIKNIDDLKAELELAKKSGRSSVLLYIVKGRGSGFVAIPLK